ncbi:MAG: HD domain-containing protein [Chitinophagaceae bacterium]
MQPSLLSEKYGAIHKHVLQMLNNKLSPKLSYHSVAHTLDVLGQAIRIAGEENIHREEDLFVLKVATLYHDTGFIFSYNGHEEKSWELAEKELPEFGINSKQLSRIHGLITATHIPQLPKNHLERIICDADLDYLGRDDFFPIAKLLFKELLTLNMVKNEQDWNLIQVRFLSSHHYFTENSIKLRSKKEAAHLAALQKVVNAYPAS